MVVVRCVGDSSYHLEVSVLKIVFERCSETPWVP